MGVSAPMQATVKFGQGGDGGRSTTGSFPTLNPTLPFPGVLQGATPPRSTRLWGLFLSPEPCSRWRTLACPVLGGRGETLILHPLVVRPLVQNSRRACLVLLFPASSLFAVRRPVPLLPVSVLPVRAVPAVVIFTPSLLYRPPTLLGSFSLFVSGNLLREAKANQTPPRIARPLFPSWSFAWRSRPSCPTDIKQRFVATTLLSQPAILFPICDIARWEPLDINSVPLGRSLILLSWNWRSDARSQLLVPSEKLPRLPLTHTQHLMCTYIISFSRQS